MYDIVLEFRNASFALADCCESFPLVCGERGEGDGLLLVDCLPCRNSIWSSKGEPNVGIQVFAYTMFFFLKKL